MASAIREFSDTLWTDLMSRLDSALASRPPPYIAAFDADGTLWDRDAGENFFDWQIQNCGFDLPADPWQHYHDLKVPDPRVAYLWLAQFSAGTELKTMHHWASECVRASGAWPDFSSQKRLFSELRKRNVEIYIVTASIKWAVEPHAARYGVDFDHVLGITTEMVEGRISRKGVHPITWRQGKAEGLLAATGGVRPVLACGNTYGDSALIESATHVQLAVSTQDQPGGPHGGLFEEERKLWEEAGQRGWLRHAFRPRP